MVGKPATSKASAIRLSPIAVDWSGFVSRLLCTRQFESDLRLFKKILWRY